MKVVYIAAGADPPPPIRFSIQSSFCLFWPNVFCRNCSELNRPGDRTTSSDRKPSLRYRSSFKVRRFIFHNPHHETMKLLLL